MRKLPELSWINERYDYNPETGKVINIKSGKAVGKPTNRYMRMRLGKHTYLIHRVVWYMQTGIDPAVDGLDIDHINHDGNDNRWSNLRVCNRSENLCNRNSWGIQKNARGNLWFARVVSNGEVMHRSSHDCPLLARMAYVDAKRELHGEYSGV